MRMTSTVVGALACQLDSYLTTFDTTVVSCRAVQVAAPATATKSGKKGKTGGAKEAEAPAVAPTVSAATEYELELQDTILFPEGGGQPSDHGIIATDSGSLPVLAIRRAVLTALHKVATPLAPETKVTLTVDWKRRFDHMQQHSGQHLISAILDTMEIPTLAWNLGEKVSYVEIARKLSDAEVQIVEDRCNDVIRQGVDIWVEVPDKDLVKKDKLPDDYDAERGILRVVHIGNLDSNPCCGTHLKNTKEMNAISLLHQVPIRGTNSRLYFLIGDRVRAYTKELHALTRSLNAKLSCQTEEIEPKISRLETQLKETVKREKQWTTEVAQTEATRVRAELTERKKSLVYRAELTGLDYFNLFMNELGKLEPGAGVIVMASGAPKTAGALVVIGDAADVVAGNIRDAGIISTLKGGGKGAKWQGKVALWEKGEPEALTAFFETL
ncbi:Threonyl/alanyl tRNA synthetase [Limtongia smithiae]|uniref:Threonyl/alanyl tRNA synthetase n=1 Tax=Limtongia smithiae TaxID=1125753 RepID=UPI0034CE3001